MTLRATALLALLGIEGFSCHRSPPPINFHSDAGARALDVVTMEVPTDAPSEPDAPRERPRLTSSAVPGDGASLVIDGVTLRAPAGEVFSQYLAWDADGDGDRDVAATHARVDGTAGRVSIHRREPAGFTDLRISGGDAPTDPRCANSTIASTTPNTLVVQWQCPPVSAAGDASVANAPAATFASEIAVFTVAPSAALRLRVTELAPPLTDTVLGLEVSALDRDGDSVEDVSVTVTARRANDRADAVVRASAVWIARGATFARDTTEPEASFARLAERARFLVTRRRLADLQALHDRTVRLRRAMCTDAGIARVRIGAELGVSCAGSTGLRGVAEALARGLLLAGELPAALALTRPDSASELGVVSSERLIAEMRRASSVEPGAIARPGPFIGQRLDAVRFFRAPALVLSPATEPTSVALRGPVTARVEVSSLAQAPGGPPDARELAPRSVDGATMAGGLFDTCAGAVVTLCPSAFADCVPASGGGAPAGGAIARIDSLPSIDHAARCVRDAASVSPISRGDVRVVGFGREGLLIVRRGRLLRATSAGTEATVLSMTSPLGGPFPPGSSASESGEYSVFATSDGVALRDSTGRLRMLSPTALIGRFRQLTDLTVSNDGRTIAGLLDGQLWLIERPAAQPPIAPIDR